uniref:Myosin IXb n=1 Tax=Neogobius melanostomus TaxID=47308 RepID=A0A8C6UZG9_9GOBI
MSARSHGSILDRGSSQSRVVQIYSRPTLDPTTYCPLQVTNCDTAQTVIQNAILMLGLDSNQTYRLIEVTASGKEENELDWDDLPLDLVLSWPPETQKWHPKEDGYYFVIQQVTDDNSCSEEYDDLCNLSDITEDSVTETLRQRFYKYKIYTYTSNILVAINPNKFLPVYYNPKYVKMYENQPLGKLSPHIFAVAAAAFRNMLSSQTNQCIVISGESGSGKTESSSYLVHCLTALSQQMYSSGLERTILGAAPVLEVSHPGAALLDWRQYGGGTVQGAVIEKYLLEKCRLVSREKNERNYHVFYNLLVGASKDEQKEFHLLKPHDYLYLRQVNLELDDEETLGQEYKRLHQAMEMVGFLPSTKKHIFSILSAILHLGNLTYSLSRDARGLEVGPDDVLVTLSELLKVKKEVLVKALTVRRAVASNFPCLCSIFQASKMRDSMAKTLYSALFDWIIFHINHALLNRRDMEEAVPCLSIGVLDMFGFEDLQKNSFEQLCINYTNEKIQCYINHHIFTMEQEDYVSEGIRWQNIDYADNSGCIELMSGKPSGLFKLLDTVRSFPDASAEGLLEKMKQQHRDNPFFVSDSESTFSVRHFAGSVTYHIKDFVEKNSEHMRLEVVSLLRGSERAFLHQLVCSSPRALFRWGVLRATIRIMTVFKHLGRKRAELRESPTKTSHTMAQRNSSTLDFSFDRSDELPLEAFEDIFDNYEKRNEIEAHHFTLFCRKTKSGRQKQLIPKNLIDLRSLQHIVGVTVHDRTSKYTDHPDGLITLPSVCTRFQASLQKLMERIKQAQPFFIVCLRSNYEKKEMHFDSGLVKRQVKCTGLLQMVLMQKAGYSAKYTFKEFVEKFRMLLPKWATPTPEHISHLLERMELDKSTYQIGKTKVFLKEHERQFLHETLNTVVMHHIVVLQRWFRGCLIRSHFLQKKDASRLIQRCWREFYEKRNRAATIIQMAWRTSLDRAESQQEERGSTRPGRDRYHYHSCIILNQCVLTDFWYFSALSSATLPHYHPHPYHMPSQYTDTVNRNPTIRISRATRATEWNSSLDREITNPKELRNLDEYLGNKVNELKSRIKELSPTEILFLTATKAFRNTIKSMFSVQVSYKDLMKGYQNKVITLAGHKQKTEVSLVVNLFQSVLDIFVRGELKRTAELDPVKTGKQTNRWRKKEKCVNHLFSTYQVTIMQSCDLCGSYIWAMEKAYMCSACKLICHKKCLSKIITDCSTRCSRMDDRLPGSLHFGVQVCVLTSKANPVPKVMELLLMHVEINGLYTEGIYRKSGSACRARELHQVLQTNPESACLDNYPIHTITGLVKRWLRELPDPLMTYALYNDFLHAAELPERSEQIRAVYQKVDELPPSNYNTLERLIFHLVRVAKEEEHNKMTSSSLAIVFAPCIMRSPDSSDPFLTMKDHLAWSGPDVVPSLVKKTALWPIRGVNPLLCHPNSAVYGGKRRKHLEQR